MKGTISIPPPIPNKPAIKPIDNPRKHSSSRVMGSIENIRVSKQRQSKQSRVRRGQLIIQYQPVPLHNTRKVQTKSRAKSVLSVCKENQVCTLNLGSGGRGQIDVGFV